MSPASKSDTEALAVDPAFAGPGVSSSPAEMSRLYTDAAIVLQLWANTPAWVQRRVEHLTLVDSDWARRSVTLNVEIPWTVMDGIAGHRVASALLPITVSARAARLIDVEATDGDRRVLALASRRQEAIVVGAAISLSLSRADPKRERDPRLFDVAHSISRTLATGATPHGDADIFTCLPESVSSLAAELIAQRLVLLRVPRDEAARCIRFVWEEEIVRAPGIFSRLRGALGGVTVLAGASGVGDYHLEVAVPETLAIEDVAFISSSGISSPRLERARDHIEVPVTGRGEVLLRLRPATGTLSLLLTFALAALGMSVALIAVAPSSASQSAVAALLLLLPGVLTLLWAGVSDWLSFVEFGVARQLLFAATFVAAGTLSIGGGHGEAVQGLLTASAGAMAIAVAALTALGFSGHRRINVTDVARAPMFVSYRTQPPATGAYPDDHEIEEAVEELIRGLPAAEASLTGRAGGGEGLQGAAALAEHSSWVASPRPPAPLLSGDLIEDVVALTGISRDGLAEALGASAADLEIEQSTGELPHTLRRQLAALRAAGLALYGGLGAAGVGQWLTAGAPAPISAIAAGRVDEVRAKLDRYMTSPAE